MRVISRLRRQLSSSHKSFGCEGCRNMETGKVKWFNNAKGFGFICPENGGEDIFAHYSTIQMDGYRTLKAGQVVRFEVHQGPKGNHASLIVPVEAETVA
ncbi:Cold shock protein CspD [Candidatus Sodalis pierantonius str. SOPE]|uniref:Cold shock-like protein CspD n=3 Tax=Bruguierivoracaceae TaxID=2812006 RepID=W0HUZ3_9GAMM|nr:Cold shock protein CspD [Candidatus Sodalis pierantonius str. SOPE]AHF77681.1 Cold shock-like protein [Sodalis praecaptivus]